jgi:dGTPase
MNDKFIKMLTPNRFRESAIKQDKSDGRLAFDSDYSRIILSSHFRRLQDKAQVFPLEKSDFVRTRLTHSLEVACFAKGLGLGVEKELIKKKYITNEFRRYIPSILEVSGLIHDIGNPPFGHFGEEVIKNFFINIDQLPDENKIKQAYNSLTPIQKEDFKNFDGNVQGFRILRKLGLAKDIYSYNLTMPILSVIMKYPYSSEQGNKKEKGLSQKKFGYFDSEKSDYDKIINELGLLNGQRHPLTYLLEAADDIAYSVSDIEDGYKLGIVTLDKIKKSLSKNDCSGELKGFKEYESNMDLYIQKLRIKVQSKMLIECTKTFIRNFNEIIEGNWDKELLKDSKAAKLRQAFEDLSIYNFSNIKVLKREILGQEVMSYLLNIFYEALFSDNLFIKIGDEYKFNKKSKEYKIYSLISDNYIKIACNEKEKFPKDNYKKFMLITDFISGMTDSYALNLYHELKGFSD